MSKNKARLIITVSMILAVIIVGGAVTWAWIEQSTLADIKGSSIELATAPGLIIKVNGNESHVINLNSYMLDMEDDPFVLAEASSVDGRNIYIRQSSASGGGETNTGNIYVHLANEEDLNHRYIQLQFSMQADEKAHDIWFDPDQSHIKLAAALLDDPNVSPNAANVIRISVDVSVEGGSNPGDRGTTIFANDKTYYTYGISEIDQITGQIVDPDESLENRQTIYEFTDFDENQPWMHLDTDEVATVVIRIWLEGQDPNCLDYLDGKIISGSTMDIKIRFQSDGEEEPE